MESLLTTADFSVGAIAKAAWPVLKGPAAASK